MEPAVLSHFERAPQSPCDSEFLQFLTFVSARELYAIDTLCVREIIEYGQGYKRTDDAGFYPRSDQSARFGGAGDRSAGAL